MKSFQSALVKLPADSLERTRMTIRLAKMVVDCMEAHELNQVQQQAAQQDQLTNQLPMFLE